MLTRVLLPWLVLGLTLAAVDVSAEDRWVLWSDSILDDTWTRHTSGLPYRDCQMAMFQKIDETAGTYYGVARHQVLTNDSSVIAVRRDGTTVIALKFRCVPDTDDPRPPRLR